MGSCAICGKKTMNFVRKCRNGGLCKSCASKFPTYLDTEKENSDVLQKLIVARDAALAKVSEGVLTTCSYGCLHVDSLNGMLVIGSVYKGIPEQGKSEVYDIANIAEYNFSLNLTGNALNRPTADVYFSMELVTPAVPVRRILVKPSDLCQMGADGDTVNLPYGAMVIQREIESAKHKKIDRQSEVASRIIETKQDADLFAAKSLFLISEDKAYSQNEINLIRLSLLTAFRGHGKDSAINHAAKILNEYMEEKYGSGYNS